MGGLGARAADLGYRAGWAAVRYLPDRVARHTFETAGSWAGRRNGGPDQLRRNLARVIGSAPAQVPDDLVAAAMRSYARYWCEAFRLPSTDPAQIVAEVNVHPADRARLDAVLARGKGAVLALPHSGNWDVAGVWLVNNYGTFATVAERLEPESLFEQFVAYRESLGFEIFPLSGGEEPPFRLLADRLRAGGIVCLLGDRDLTSSGVPVTFFGEPTRMPAGPAKLAQETGAGLLPVFHRFRDGRNSDLRAETEIDVSVGVDTATQQLAHAFEDFIADAPEDWHMLQPLWEADWSQARRDRIRGN